MCCKDALDKRNHTGSMEDIELLSILLEDFCEAKLFNCASAIVVRWVENDMCWRTALSLIDCKEATRGAIGKCWVKAIWPWWTKAQEDLEESRIRLWWRVHHPEKLYPRVCL